MKNKKRHLIGFTQYELEVLLKQIEGKKLEGYDLMSLKRIRQALRVTLNHATGVSDDEENIRIRFGSVVPRGRPGVRCTNDDRVR